jgi:hypothetical protein
MTIGSLESLANSIDLSAFDILAKVKAINKSDK